LIQQGSLEDWKTGRLEVIVEKLFNLTSRLPVFQSFSLFFGRNISAFDRFADQNSPWTCIFNSGMTYTIPYRGTFAVSIFFDTGATPDFKSPI
jgi:hypothetical protein